MVRTCKNCNKQFELINNTRGVFCCLPCYREYRKKDNTEYRMAQYITVTCEQCGKVFDRRKSETGRGKTFCSHVCAGLVSGGKANRAPSGPSVEKNCEICGKPYKAKASRPNRRYCSIKCRSTAHSEKMSGEGNAHYKHGKSQGSAHWQAKRHYEQKCIICGFDVVVQVHHILPKAEGGTNDPGNLAVLCPNHHAMAHLNLIPQATLVELAAQAKQQKEST